MIDLSAINEASNKTDHPRRWNELLRQFRKIRAKTIKICDPLEREDHVVQPNAEVSPPKWHLGHTTWLFEELLLVPYLKDYVPFNIKYALLFNSYYKAVGEHWQQSERGQLSRPTVEEILAYRRHVDAAIAELFRAKNLASDWKEKFELALHHEQQHHELLYMDIKYILGHNPLRPPYLEHPAGVAQAKKMGVWNVFAENLYDIGAAKHIFSYDNENPQHKSYLYGFEMAAGYVTNGEYLEFIEDRGYETPAHWLSLGWDWINQHKISSPLYWSQQDSQWLEYNLAGEQPLDLQAPVVHISYFEAQAYALWKGHRLPTEQESEVFLTQGSPEFAGSTETITSPEVDVLGGYNSNLASFQGWWWTSSSYSPYPGFKPFGGMAKEYNGKFMCNQYVLKGGSFATDLNHFRPSYRNFYAPHQRWLFSGLRLAKDKK